MLERVLKAIVVAVVVFIVCVLVGDLLNALGAPKIGDFIGGNSGLIGALAGLWYYFFGGDTLRKA